MAENPTSTAGAVTREREALTDVCSGVAALFRSRWGRGPHRCRAHWAGPDALVVLLQDAHTEAERTLVVAGRAEDVLAGRRAFNAVAEHELRAIVEHATGRSVTSFLGASRVAPDVSAEVFLLVPDSAPERSGAPGQSTAPLQADAGRTVAGTEPLIAQSEPPAA